MTVTFDEKYLQERLPEKPISTLKDIQYLYGVLEIAKREDPTTYGPLFTVFNNSGKESSLICCDLVRTETGLEFEKIIPSKYPENNADKKKKIAFSKYNAPKGKDHSLTQETPKSPTKEKIASYLEDCFDWVNEDAVQDYMEDKTESEIKMLQLLEEFSEDKEEIEKATEELKEVLPENELTKALVTVRIKPSGNEDFKFAGEFKEILGATEYRNKYKQIKKTFFDRKSEGKGKTALSDSFSDNLVGAPEDSLSGFKTKQQSTFYGLLHDESSWTAYPISLEESLHIGRSEEYVNELFEKVFSRRMYFLPYPSGVLTVEKAKRIGHFLEKLKEDSQSSIITQINKASGNINFDEDLFYVLGLNKRSTMKEFFGEIPYLTRPQVIDIHNTYGEIVDSLIGAKDGCFFEDSLSDTLSSQGVTYLFDKRIQSNSSDWPDVSTVLNGTWIKKAFKHRMDSEYNNSDRRALVYWAVLERSKVKSDILYKEFITRIEDTHTDSMYSMSKTLQRRLFHQFCFLLTLLEKDMVNQGEINKYSQTNGNYMDFNDNSPVTRLISAVNRKQVFESEVNKYCFAIGVLTGRVSEYQSSVEGRTSTVLRSHPINRINSERLKKVVSEAIDKSNKYDGLQFTNDYIEYIREVQPTEEALENTQTSQIKYYFALGVAFGSNDFYNSKTN